VKADYFCSVIADFAGDQKKLYKIVDSWLSYSRERSLPTHQFPTDLTNTFSSFFCDKVDAIEEEFSIVSMEEVSRAITASFTKSCSLDLIPTHILKKILLLFVPAITSIVNLSLEPVCFPMFSSMTSP
jgi:hypothetical protein